MSKVAVTELGYVGVAVRDMRAWQNFASAILGLEWSDAGEGDRVYLRMDYWHHRIVLHQAGANDAEDLLYAGLRVAGPDEFQAMQQQLKAQGVAFTLGTPEQAAERHVLEVLRTTDPAGVPIEIFHGPEVNRGSPFRPGRGMHAPFSTGNGGLGHIVVRDDGPDKSYRFYSHALGMSGSVEAKIRLPNGFIQQPTFMHCNGRDHTLAFGAGPMKRTLHHIMLETQHVDDVGIAYDLVRRANIPLLMTLGKHANDNMISFYVQTPSGWFIEYGSGGTPANPQSEYCTSDVWGHEPVGMHLMAALM
jgi:2,3-dihydroxybiphenyl 1,2-dioxygenase